MSCGTGLCYGSISLFSTILHNIFILYHFDMFISVYRIDKTSFWIGEAIFLVWNSINDPLFGWLGDRQHISSADKKSEQAFNVHSPSSDYNLHRRNNEINTINESTQQNFNNDETGASPSVIVQRSTIISFCGPLFALCFSLIWFDWLIPSVQFPICLCLYDAFLTLIDLQQSALLAELSITLNSRTRMNTYESIFSAMGSSSVFLSYYLWDKNDLTYFRMFCLFLAALSALGYYIVANILKSKYMQKVRFRTHELSKTKCSLRDFTQHIKTYNNNPLRLFIRQMLSHTNFLVFAVINIIQVNNFLLT